jgi:hypothetical protein
MCNRTPLRSRFAWEPWKMLELERGEAGDVSEWLDLYFLAVSKKYNP